MTISEKLYVSESADNVGKSTPSEWLTRHLHESGIRRTLLAFPGREVGTLGQHIWELHLHLGVLESRIYSRQVCSCLTRQRTSRPSKPDQTAASRCRDGGSGPPLVVDARLRPPWGCAAIRTAKIGRTGTGVLGSRRANPTPPSHTRNASQS